MRRERISQDALRTAALWEFCGTSEPPDLDQAPVLESQIDLVVPDLRVYNQLPFVTGFCRMLYFVERDRTRTVSDLDLVDFAGELHGYGAADGFLDCFPDSEAIGVTFLNSVVEKPEELAGTEKNRQGNYG